MKYVVSFGSGVVAMGSAVKNAEKIKNEGFVEIPSNLENAVKALFGDATHGERKLPENVLAMLQDKIQKSNAVIEEAEALKKEGLEAIPTDDLEALIQADLAKAEETKLEELKSVKKTEAFNWKDGLKERLVVYYKHSNKKGAEIISKAMLIDFKGNNILVASADSKSAERFGTKELSLADVINVKAVVEAMEAKEAELKAERMQLLGLVA